MNVNDRIVFLDGMFPSIIWPVGPLKEGGTCEYLTDHCLQYCPAQETNDHERRSLEFFRQHDYGEIVERIKEDLSYYGLLHLYWWTWGDCPPDLTSKVATVMLWLRGHGVLQNGFTRNPELWRAMNREKEQSDNLKLGGHVDVIGDVKDYRFRNRIVCCPDISVGKAELYFNGDKVARCCGLWCDWIKTGETRAADCQDCFLYNQGCFYGSCK